MTKVCIVTLGCKVNKYESDCMRNMLEKNDYQVANSFEIADIYILNTCAVTNEAEKKSRQYIAKIKKQNAHAKIIICGCASENNAKQFDNNDENCYVFGVKDKENILDIIKNIDNKNLKNKLFEKKHKILFETNKAQHKDLAYPKTNSTRVFVKIQDGCNNFCSYCIIPYLRGRSRSRKITEIVKECEELAKIHKEIVLTGINISDFKVRDKIALGELIYNLKHINCRFRLGSLEVRVIDDNFLEILKQTNNFMPHFHLSLQSGDNEILKKMNRHYTNQQFIQKCNLIYKYFPEANITTDIIVGFPTETREQFLNSLKIVKIIEFGDIHVFKYSKKIGTAACDMLQIAPNEITQREKEMEKIKHELNINFYKKNLNKIRNVLTEDIEDGFVVGYTENYIKVYLKIAKKNQVLKVKCTEIFKNGMKGEIVYE